MAAVGAAPGIVSDHKNLVVLELEDTLDLFNAVLANDNYIVLAQFAKNSEGNDYGARADIRFHANAGDTANQ